MTVTREAKNFPTTTSTSFTGEVKSSSNVPSFCSSAISLIVIAGDIKIIKNVAPAKYPLMVASENASDTEATKKNPVIAKYEADTI